MAAITSLGKTHSSLSFKEQLDHIKGHIEILTKVTEVYYEAIKDLHLPVKNNDQDLLEQKYRATASTSERAIFQALKEFKNLNGDVEKLFGEIDGASFKLANFIIEKQRLYDSMLLKSKELQKSINSAPSLSDGEASLNFEALMVQKESLDRAMANLDETIFFAVENFRAARGSMESLAHGVYPNSEKFQKVFLAAHEP